LGPPERLQRRLHRHQHRIVAARQAAFGEAAEIFDERDACNAPSNWILTIKIILNLCELIDNVRAGRVEAPSRIDT